MHVVIIGGSFAGASCALETKRLYPEAQVTLLDQQAALGFIPSGLNLYLNDEIGSLDEAYAIQESELRLEGIDVRLNTYVTALDPNKQEVHYHSLLKQESMETLSYDRLVLAMGSRQSSPLVEEMSDPRIISSKELVSAKQAVDLLDDVQYIGVIGGGQIGVEATEALINANKQVVLIEKEATILSRSFDPEFVAPIQEAIEMTGVDLRLQETVQAIDDRQVDGIGIQTDTDDLVVDAVLLGVDLLPQNQLVQDWLDLNENGTIPVDEYLETAVKNIFAVGDLVESYHQPSQSHQFIALVNNAVRSGQVAAFNLFEKRVKNHQSLNLLGSRVFSQYMISIGRTEDQVDEEVQVISLSDSYSVTDQRPVELKLITQVETGRILGAQMRSEANILAYADTLSLAIGHGMKDQDLAFQDRLYYPRQTSPLPLIYQAALRSFEARLSHIKE